MHIAIVWGNIEITQNNDIDIYATVWNKDDNNMDVSDAFIFQLPEHQVQYVDIDKYNTNKTLITLDYKRDYSIDYILSLSKHEIFTRFMDESKKKERGTHFGFTNEALEYWINRIKDQYFLINQASTIIENIQQYDLIFRIRTDFKFLKTAIINYDVKEYEIVFINGYDCFQYGRVNAMSKYFNLYHYVDNYSTTLARLNKHGYDTFNAENMVRHYMKTFGDSCYDIYETNFNENKDFTLGR